MLVKKHYYLFKQNVLTFVKINYIQILFYLVFGKYMYLEPEKEDTQMTTLQKCLTDVKFGHLIPIFTGQNIHFFSILFQRIK